MTRVVSLLPAGTEIVAALGALDSLVGVSHECDFPPQIGDRPRVTTTTIDPMASGRSINAAVRQHQASRRSTIAVDAEQLGSLKPDLILVQDLCEVCALSDGQLHRLAAALDPSPRVLSLVARDLAGIWADIREVGAALERVEESHALRAEGEARLARLRHARPRATTSDIPRVLCVEWLDPLYLAGHWVPELVAAAGGENIGAVPGAKSTRWRWKNASRLQPDVVIVMLCGFGVARAQHELSDLSDPDALALFRTTPTWVLDGNSYTSRSGPRVVDGAERIRAALQGEEMAGLVRWRPM
jgi:iron complex transport system substrate-binding protein